MRVERGFALLTVLWVLIIVSSIALSLTAAAGVEARIAANEREALGAERLAMAGLEMAPYLEVRGLGSAQEDLAGLPIEIMDEGFHYRIGFPEGSVDLFFEGDNGKINPLTAPEILLRSFFSNWTRDPREGERLTQAFQDWTDPDETPRLLGAEALAYLGSGYAPRNGQPGISDLPLIRGIRLEDLRPSLMETRDGRVFRGRLDQYLTTSPVGARVNPNFASRWVLEAVPGLDPPRVERIIEERARILFGSSAEFASRVGLPDTAPLLDYLQFARGDATAVLAVGHAIEGSGTRRSLRRVYHSTNRLNPATGFFERRTALARIERNVFPEFAEVRLTN